MSEFFLTNMMRVPEQERDAAFKLRVAVDDLQKYLDKFNDALTLLDFTLGQTSILSFVSNLDVRATTHHRLNGWAFIEAREAPPTPIPIPASIDSYQHGPPTCGSAPMA
jgi:hypothetical protein